MLKMNTSEMALRAHLIQPSFGLSIFTSFQMAWTPRNKKVLLLVTTFSLDFSLMNFYWNWKWERNHKCVKDFMLKILTFYMYYIETMVVDRMN